VGAQVQPAFALPAGEPGGYLPEPVAQQFRGGVAQVACGEGEVAVAGQQVRGQGDDLGPGEVDRPEAGGPVVEAEVLGLFDVVLHVHVGAVAGIEPGDLSGSRVGDDQLVAAAEGLLPVGGPFAVAGMQRFVADQDPQPGDRLLPGVQVEQAGQLGDVGVL